MSFKGLRDMKKCINIILVISIILVNLCLLSGQVIASKDPYTDITPVDIADAEKLGTSMNKVIGIIQVVGMTAAVIVLIIIGMKYVMASAQDRASIKQHLFIYIVGAVLLFAVTGVLEIVKTFSNEAFTYTTSAEGAESTEDHEE